MRKVCFAFYSVTLTVRSNLLEAVLLKLEVSSMSAAALFAIISPDQELKIVGWSMIGAILGGFVGTYFLQPKTIKDWMLRWLVNIIAGVIVGLVSIAHLEGKYPHIPITWQAMFVSSIVGPIIVLALPIGIPLLKTFLVNKITELTEKSQKRRSGE